MSKKWKYTSPKVTAVVLDPKQAILQVCQVGGNYMVRRTGQQAFCSRGVGTEFNCWETPKGGETAIGGATEEDTSIPS